MLNREESVKKRSESCKNLSKIERETNLKLKQETLSDQLKYKQALFKSIKQLEFDQYEAKKNSEKTKKSTNQEKLIQKIKELEIQTKMDEEKLNDYENEEMDILKRMQKSTVMLSNSMYKFINLLVVSVYFQGLSIKKGKNQFSQNPYKNLLEAKKGGKTN